MFSWIFRSSRSAPAAAPPARPLFEALEGRLVMSAAVTSPVADAPVAAPPAALTASATAPVARPAAQAVRIAPLGGNLQYQTESSLDHAFADLVKSSTGFRKLTGGFARTDANGWPLEDFTIPLWDTAWQKVQVDVGRYNVSFTGPAGAKLSLADAPAAGKPSPKVTKLGYDAATGRHTYAVDVPAGVFRLALKGTGTLGQVKNLRVLQPGVDPANPPVFAPKYLNFLKSLRPDTLRLMDWNRTNNNTVGDWALRPRTSSATQTGPGGVAWEYSIQLANAVGSNLYICVPGHASDDYVRQLATLVRNTLNPNLKVYVEYSNEVWNTEFEQGRYNLQQAINEVVAAAKAGRRSTLNYDNRPVDVTQTAARPTSHAYAWADRRIARRGKEIADIFKAAWVAGGRPNPLNNQVRVVMASQGANTARFTDMLKYVQATQGAPKNWFYAIGIAPYFGLNKYRDNFVDGKWTTPNANLTTDQVLEGMGLSVASYEKGVFSRTAAIAKPYGLRLVAYEGGSDTFGPHNVAAKKRATLDPRIKAVVERYLNAWYAQGGDLINWFFLGAKTFDSASGTYSITNSLTDLNQPREQVFRSYRGAAPIV